MGYFKYECELEGANLSIVGTKHILIDCFNQKIEVSDSGGIFGNKIVVPIPLSSVSFNIYSINNGFQIKFKTKIGYSGKFTINDIPAELIAVFQKFSAVDIIKNNIEYNPILYDIQFRDWRNNFVHIGNDTSQLSKCIIGITSDYIKLVILKEKDLVVIEYIEFDRTGIKSLSYDASNIKLKTAFIYNKTIISEVIINKNLFDNKLKNFIEKFLIPDVKKDTNDISSILMINGKWKDRVYENVYWDFGQIKNQLFIFRELKTKNQNTWKIKIDEINQCELIGTFLVIKNIFDEMICLEGDSIVLKNIIDSSLTLTNIIMSKNIYYGGTKEILALEVKNGKIDVCMLFIEDKIIKIKYNGLENKISYDSIINYKYENKGVYYEVKIKTNSCMYLFFISQMSNQIIELSLLKHNVVYSNKVDENEFIHPNEKQAFMNLTKLFIAENTLKDYYENIQERINIPDQLGKTVAVSPSQFPKVWEIVKRGSELLKIKMPEVYIFESFHYSIDAEGYNYPRIEISAKTIEDFSEEELKFIVGSNLAHIAVNHIETEVLSEGILTIIPQIKKLPIISTLANLLPVAETTEMYLKLRLADWSRLSVLTGDRFGYAFSGSLESSVSAIMKLILNSLSLLKELDVSTYMLQKEKLNAFLGIAAFYSKADEFTPYGMDRIINIVSFANSLQGRILKEKIELMEKQK